VTRRLPHAPSCHKQQAGNRIRGSRRHRRRRRRSRPICFGASLFIAQLNTGQAPHQGDLGYQSVQRYLFCGRVCVASLSLPSAMAEVTESSYEVRRYGTEYRCRRCRTSRWAHQPNERQPRLARTPRSFPRHRGHHSNHLDPSRPLVWVVGSRSLLPSVGQHRDHLGALSEWPMRRAPVRAAHSLDNLPSSSVSHRMLSGEAPPAIAS